MARVRDYALERERRNIRAQRMGFSSLDQVAKARKQGWFPSAAAIRKDATARERAEAISSKRLARASNKPLDTNAPFVERKKARETAVGEKSARRGNMRDRDLTRWSDAHSRQEGTRFDPGWNDKRKDDYYNAFVRDWILPSDERDFSDTYYYMDEYGGFDEDPHDNPYSER